MGRIEVRGFGAAVANDRTTTLYTFERKAFLVSVKASAANHSPVPRNRRINGENRRK